MERYKVTLTRGEKQNIVVLRADDYEQSVRRYKDCNKMYYGSGPMWSVVSVEAL